MCESGVEVISTSAIDEEDKEEDQVAVEETRAVSVFDQVIVSVNLLSKQYCAFNTNKFVLNYEYIPILFACQHLKGKNKLESTSATRIKRNSQLWNQKKNQHSIKVTKTKSS